MNDQQSQVADLSVLVDRLRFALGDTNCKLTHSQLVRRAYALSGKAREWDEWKDAQEQIETEMPEGWRLVMDCSPGDWSLDLIDPDGAYVDFDHDWDSTAKMIGSAIERAKARAAIATATQAEGKQ